MRRINGLTALVTIFLVAFALRVFRLDVQSLWYDEAFSVYLAHFDLASLTARTAADIQPPLYYYLLHGWIAFAGDSEFALRFLSLCFGVLTIPLIFVTARRLFDRNAAYSVALLAVASPLYLWYSQEARMYTLITFLLLLSSFALLRALAAPNSRWWIAFTLANIAAVYTHYFAFVVIAFQLLYGFGFTFHVSRLTIKNWIYVLFSFAAIFIAFLPWFPFLFARLGQDASYWQGVLKLDEAIRHIFINFTTGESVLENIAQSIAVGWVSVLWLGLAAWFVNQKSKIRNQKSSIVFSLLYLSVPLVLLLFLFYRNPKFNARYLMVASPAFFLLLGAGLGNIWSLTHRVLRFTLYGFAFSFLLFTSCYAAANAYFDPAFTKASFRDVTRFIESHIAPNEAIILTSGHLFPAFNYYYRGSAPTIRLPDDPTLNAEHVLGYDTANVLNQTLGGKRGVWVVLWQDEVVDPNGFVPMLLSSQGKEEPITGTSFYQVRLQHWVLQPNARFSPQPAPAIRRETNFDNKIKLLGATATLTPADIGASFNLDWQTLDALDDDYLIALRVRDATGNLWGKQDRRPAGYIYPTTRWKKGENLFGAYTVPLMPGTPAGDYFIEATLYTKSNESGLDVLAPNGAPMGKSVKIGPIRVLPATKPAMLAALNISNTISEPFGPFTLLGYQLGRDKASAGETIPLTLFWRADSQLNTDHTFRVQFDTVTSDPLSLANAQFPTSQWRAGEIVRGQYAIAIPATAKAGAIKLRVVLSDSNAIDLAPFTIEKTDRVFVKPSMPFAQKAIFGADYLALVGYDMPANVKPGDTLKLTLSWQAQAKMDKPYTVFVHLLGSDGKPIAQKDAEPLNGARPTTGWVANEYIVDAYELPIKPETAPGKYQIEIGWYDAKDFSRLQVFDANGVPTNDHVILKASMIVQ